MNERKLKMSTIKFICNDTQYENLKTGVWSLILEHYLSSAFPNTNANYEHEGKDVYRERMHQLMLTELCHIEACEDGIIVDFDSTEDAGFSIAKSVYGTEMDYSDQGLTFLLPLFKNIVENFPDICFDADTECIDNWVEAYDHFSYDGNILTQNGIDADKYELVMANMFLSPEEIAEKTGLSFDEVMEIISNN